jgi:methyl-accepting chemotaxis protein
MRIKRFNESETVDISTKSIDRIVKELNEISASIKDKAKTIESLNIELKEYVSDSQKGNDQIDNSIFALQVIEKNLEVTQDKIDTILQNMKSYNDEGRKYLLMSDK